jgi:teichuronic acid exporter
MSLAQAVGKGVAWTMVNTVAEKILTFANIFIVLHFLSVYEYGLSQLVLSVISTASIFLLPGLGSSVIADLSAEHAAGAVGKMKSLFWQYFTLNFTSGVLLWIVLFFASNPIAHLLGNASLGSFLQIASFLFLIGPLRTASLTLALVKLRYLDESFYGTLEEGAKLGLLIVFFYGFHFSVSGLLAAIVLSQFTALLLYIPRSYTAYAEMRGVPSKDIGQFWKLFQGHRKWGITSSYLSTLSQNITLWIIRAMLGTEAVGIYAFATGLLSQISSFLPLGGILAPLLPRYLQDTPMLIRLLTSSIKAQALFALVLIVCGFIGAPLLILIFPKYGLALPLFFILLISLVLNAIATIYTSVFTAFKKQLSYLFSTLFKLFCNIILFPLCIVLFGIPGLGLAYVFAMLLSTVERTVRLQRELPEFRFASINFFKPDPLEQELLADWFSGLKAKLFFHRSL